MGSVKRPEIGRLISIALLVLLSACSERHADNANLLPPASTEDSAVTVPRFTMNEQHMSELLDSALNKGSHSAYNEASVAYMIDGRERDLFYYAFRMANTHDDPQACYDVFVCLVCTSESEILAMLNSLDPRMKSIALFHLLRSNELGWDQAPYYLEIIYKDSSFIPTSDQLWNKELFMLSATSNRRAAIPSEP